MYRNSFRALLCLKTLGSACFKDVGLIRRSSSLVHIKWVSARDEAAAFASSIVRFPSPELPSPSSVEYAVKEALASVRHTLGSDCHAFLLTTSLPRPLVAFALSFLHQQTHGAPITGCSSLQWQPMSDLPNVTPKQAPSPGAASSAAEPSSSTVRTRAEAEHHQQYHITLGAMHVPNADVHTFHTPTSSLPSIPNLASALSSRPSPVFILMGTHEGTVDILKDRLENLFSQGSVACATTGTLQMPSRQTIGGLAVPSGLRGMELWGVKSSNDAGVRWESRGSNSSSSSSRPAISNTSLKDVGPMAFLNETILSVGCCGLMLLPRKSTPLATSSSSSRDKAAPCACLPPASCALLSQSLLGHERFFSLMISDAALRYLQPPHMPARTWQHLKQQHKAPSLAAANAAMQHSRRQQQQQQQLGSALGAWEEGLPCPPVAPLPDNIRVSDCWEVSCEGRRESEGDSGSASSSDPSTVAFTSSISNCSSSSSSGSKDGRKGASGSSPKASKAPQRRLPAASFPSWSLSSQVHACGGSGVPHVVYRLQRPIPIISFGPNFSIFPGEEVQLRIFEKRYQWLIRQAVHQHGCFGIASARGMGTAVIVNRYILNNSDFYIVVEGSSRLLFNPAWAASVPTCFGLAAVEDVLVVQDQAQLTPAETAVISRTAGQILSLLATGAQAYVASISSEPASNAGPVFLGGMMQQQQALQSGSTSDSDSDRSDSDSDDEDEGADGGQEGQQESRMLGQAYAQQLEMKTLDAASASQFSLMLSALMPIEVEKRRKFMLTFNSQARLSEQKKHLASFPNVAASAAGTLMGSPPTHPLRQLLGLQDLPPLNQD